MAAHKRSFPDLGYQNLYGTVECVYDPRHREKIAHHVLDACRAVPSNSWLSNSFDGPCLGSPQGHLSWSRGVVLGRFDPLNVILRIVTSYSQFLPQTIPKSFTTKSDTLVHLRLVPRCLGRLNCKNSQILQTEFMKQYDTQFSKIINS